MIDNLCPSCGDDLDWPSGDGCANMTAHKNDNLDPNDQEAVLYNVLKENLVVLPLKPDTRIV